MINRIIDETGVKIDIEQDGRIYIASTDPKQNEAAKKIIEDLVREVVVGETYMGTVKRVEKYGAFVEVLPGKEGLVHISQLDATRVNKVSDVVKVGDTIMVKVTEIDDQGADQLVAQGRFERTVFGEIRGGHNARPIILFTKRAEQSGSFLCLCSISGSYWIIPLHNV